MLSFILSNISFAWLQFRQPHKRRHAVMAFLLAGVVAVASVGVAFSIGGSVAVAQKKEDNKEADAEKVKDAQQKRIDLLEQHVNNQELLHVNRLESVESRLELMNSNVDKVLMVFGGALLLALMAVVAYQRTTAKLSQERIQKASEQAEGLMRDIQRELTRPETEYLRISYFLRRLMREFLEGHVASTNIAKARVYGQDPNLPVYLHGIARTLVAAYEERWKDAIDLLDNMRQMDREDPFLLLHLSNAHTQYAQTLNKKEQQYHNKLSSEYYAQYVVMAANVPGVPQATRIDKSKQEQAQIAQIKTVLQPLPTESQPESIADTSAPKMPLKPAASIEAPADIVAKQPPQEKPPAQPIPAESQPAKVVAKQQAPQKKRQSFSTLAKEMAEANAPAAKEKPPAKVIPAEPRPTEVVKQVSQPPVEVATKPTPQEKPPEVAAKTVSEEKPPVQVSQEKPPAEVVAKPTPQDKPPVEVAAKTVSGEKPPVQVSQEKPPAEVAIKPTPQEKPPEVAAKPVLEEKPPVQVSQEKPPVEMKAPQEIVAVSPPVAKSDEVAKSVSTEAAQKPPAKSVIEPVKKSIKSKFAQLIARPKQNTVAKPVAEATPPMTPAPAVASAPKTETAASKAEVTPAPKPAEKPIKKSSAKKPASKSSSPKVNGAVNGSGKAFFKKISGAILHSADTITAQMGKKELDPGELPFLAPPELSSVPTSGNANVIKMWECIHEGDSHMIAAHSETSSLRRRNKLIDAALSSYDKAQTHKTNAVLYMNWGKALQSKAMHAPLKQRESYFNAAVDKLKAGNFIAPNQFDFAIASLYAMAGNEAECREWLQKSFESGSLDKEILKSDPQFASMRNQPWFTTFSRDI